jgi:hypothetical protein
MVTEEQAKQALRTLNSLHDLGDAVYDVRERLTEEPWPEGVENSWDHPRVLEYSSSVEILKAWLAQ